MKNYDEKYLTHVFQSLSEPIKKLITPYHISDEKFIENWYESKKGPTNTYPIENGYKTVRGEIVRSKSEMILMDKLYANHIPYLYEAPLKLNNGHTIYPDSTVLNVKTRKTIYVEIAGMMDTPDYCNKFLEKIKIYGENNIFLGESLFVLMESGKVGIDIRQMDYLIQHFFL